MPYDDDNFGANQMLHFQFNPAGANDAAEVMAHFKFFNRVKITAATAIVLGTAYTADACALNFYKDAGSFGGLVMGTATINSVIDATLTDTVFETTNSLEIQQVSAASVGLSDVFIQYQELFG